MCSQENDGAQPSSALTEHTNITGLSVCAGSSLTTKGSLRSPVLWVQPSQSLSPLCSKSCRVSQLDVHDPTQIKQVGAEGKEHRVMYLHNNNTVDKKTGVKLKIY